MFNDKQELNDMKTKIDLRQYAAGQGYQLDPKGSWRGTAVMRHPATHDKVIIKRDTDGHYVYFSVRDDRDNGTILDFVMQRQRVNFGMARKELRPWLGVAPVSVPVFDALPKTSGPSGLTDRFSTATAPANWFQELCLTSTRWLNTWFARRRCMNSRKHGRAPGIATRRAEGWKSGLEHGHPETGPPVAARPWRSSSAPAEVALQLRWLGSH